MIYLNLLYENYFVSIAIIAFFTGLFVKIVDNLIDDKGSYKIIQLFLGLIYGFFISIMCMFFIEVMPLWLGIMIGIFFSNKIDGFGHKVGFFSALFFILVLYFVMYPIGFKFIEVFVSYTYAIVLFLIALIVTVFEEKYHDAKSKNKFLNAFFEYRLLTEFVVLIISLLTWNFLLIIALLSFDIGYIIVEKVKKK